MQFLTLAKSYFWHVNRSQRVHSVVMDRWINKNFNIKHSSHPNTRKCASSVRWCWNIKLVYCFPVAVSPSFAVDSVSCGKIAKQPNDKQKRSWLAWLFTLVFRKFQLLSEWFLYTCPFHKSREIWVFSEIFRSHK